MKKRIVGYADQISVAPGETINFKVTADGVPRYHADVVRLISCDHHPGGSGTREEVIDTAVSDDYDGRWQETYAGSFAVIDNRAPFDAMVWEALRFVPIRPDIFRQAGTGYTIAKGTSRETEIKAGTIVRLLTQSAMFDDYAFENPDEFNPDRNFYHSFVFGFGSHDCLGKYVGMEMIPEMVRQVVLLDDLDSDGGINYRNKTFPDRDGPFPEEYRVTWS